MKTTRDEILNAAYSYIGRALIVFDYTHEKPRFVWRAECPAAVRMLRAADSLDSFPLDVVALSLEFEKRLKAQLGEDWYGEAVAENTANHSSSGCASHDHCDANQVMIDAIEALNGGTFEHDGADELQADMVNAAWDLWRVRSYLEVMRGE